MESKENPGEELKYFTELEEKEYVEVYGHHIPSLF
jgi:hypothetical protein